MDLTSGEAAVLWRHPHAAGGPTQAPAIYPAHVPHPSSASVRSGPARGARATHPQRGVSLHELPDRRGTARHATRSTIVPDLPRGDAVRALSQGPGALPLWTGAPEGAASPARSR